MTRDEIRYLAHKLLDRIEWLNFHATTRHPKDRQKLDDTIVDMEKMALKIIDAPLRENDLDLPTALEGRSPASLQSSPNKPGCEADDSLVETQ